VSRDLLWPGIVMSSTVAMIVVTIIGLGPPIAPAVALWFVFVCPGLPYVRLLELREPLNEFLLAIALSLSIEAVVSLLLLWSSAWSSGRMLQVIIGITMLGAMLDADRTVSGRATAVRPVVTGEARR